MAITSVPPSCIVTPVAPSIVIVPSESSSSSPVTPTLIFPKVPPPAVTSPPTDMFEVTEPLMSALAVTSPKIFTPEAVAASA